METKKDFTGGDHSFSSWWKLQWQNFYIQLFLIFFPALILQLCNISWCVEVIETASIDGFGAVFLTCLGMSLPGLGTCILIYKAFIQYWQDMIKGKSR